jgi:hypothetical protein
MMMVWVLERTVWSPDLDANGDDDAAHPKAK